MKELVNEWTVTVWEQNVSKGVHSFNHADMLLRQKGDPDNIGHSNFILRSFLHCEVSLKLMYW